MMMMESDKVAAPLGIKKLLMDRRSGEKTENPVVDTMLSRLYLRKALNDKCY